MQGLMWTVCRFHLLRMGSARPLRSRGGLVRVSTVRRPLVRQVRLMKCPKSPETIHGRNPDPHKTL